MDKKNPMYNYSTYAYIFVDTLTYNWLSDRVIQPISLSFSNFVLYHPINKIISVLLSPILNIHNNFTSYTHCLCCGVNLLTSSDVIYAVGRITIELDDPAGIKCALLGHSNGS